MQSIAKSRLWIVVGVMCILLLVFALAGCNNTGSTNDLDSTITGNQVEDVTSGGNNSSGSSGIFAGSGTQTSSNGIATAVPSTGSVLSYWLRTKDGITAKYATDINIAETSGATYQAVFVSESDIVKVSTAEQLLNAMAENKYIVLTQDIDATSNFSTLTSFSGVLDGAGHKITVNVSSPDANVAGLCNTLSGVIKNVVLEGTIEGTGFSTDQKVGSFATTLNGGLISRCENRAMVVSGNGTASGFVAQGSGGTRSSTVYYSINYGSVTGGKVGVIIFTNGTKESPLVNLVSNENYGAVQTNTVGSGN